MMGTTFLAKTDRDWEYWGAHDAYFGVLSTDRFRKEQVDAHRDEFFATGRQQIDHRLAHLESRLGPIARHRALDFGCGVGRLTEALAKQFDAVTGLDISRSMLGEAERNASAHGLSTITYALSDDGLTNAQGPFDFVHSCMVIQHIPRTQGMSLIPKLLALTAPGGVASLHVCVGRDIARGKALSHWFRHHVPLVQGVANIRRGEPWQRPSIRMYPYALPEVLDQFAHAGLGNVTVDMERHGDFATAYVAGRKA
jgi:SAM-dependent methyltransferase